MSMLQCARSAQLHFFFFTHFHVLKVPVPDFAPDFDDPDYGEYGRRRWYELYLFSSAQDCTKEMVYQSKTSCLFYSNNKSLILLLTAHRYNVKNMFQEHDINISKVTHAGRGYTAKNAHENGASQSEVKALGCWSDAGSYRPFYDRALPIEAVLASAGFDGK